MSQATARLFLPLLQLLLPPVGRHRATDQRSFSRPMSAPRVAALSGEDIGLVRPYLVAHERRQQRVRRRALYLAAHGVGFGPRRIRGAEVSA
ncbi:hypothetical protein CGL27_20880 [Streptomyces sp. 11-1-2]|nr:hypothetical protein CGL27_20880 [Streptomyces sp. 11-1-2]